MPADLDSIVDQLLASYSKVEPRPDAVQAWLDRASQPARHRRMLAPFAWAAVAVTLALLLVLGVAWLRSRNHNPSRPTLAQERTTLVPAPSQTPLTDEQKQLIQILQSNPSALATMKPGQAGAQPQKKEKHP